MLRVFVFLIGLWASSIAGAYALVACAQAFDALGGFRDIAPYAWGWSLTFALSATILAVVCLPIVRRDALAYAGASIGVAALGALGAIIDPLDALTWTGHLAVSLAGAALAWISIRSRRIAIAIPAVGAALVGGTLTATALRGYEPSGATLTESQRDARRFLAGPVWDGTSAGRGRLPRQALERYTALPLYWLGDRFAGYNLQSVGGSEREVTFIYGACTIERQHPLSDGGCAVPAYVGIRSNCFVRPEQVSGPFTTIRGDALMWGLEPEGRTSATLWTGPVVISLGVPADPALLRTAIEQLRGVGVNSAVQPGDPLPPPDFSGCGG